MAYLRRLFHLLTITEFTFLTITVMVTYQVSQNLADFMKRSALSHSLKSIIVLNQAQASNEINADLRAAATNTP
jgi:hypothetical protein